MGIISTYFAGKEINRVRNNIFTGVLILVFCMGMANTLDYFFAGPGILKTYRGEVIGVKHDEYYVRSGRSRPKLYSRTTIFLKNTPNEFWIADRADEGGYVDVIAGDFLTLYTKQWFQTLYLVLGPSNVYVVEKDGKWIYNNTGEWKTSTFRNMVFMGILFLFLLLAWLDIVRRISMFNWIKKRLQ